MFLFYMVLGIFIGNYIRIEAFVEEGGAIFPLSTYSIIKGLRFTVALLAYYLE